jgi:hypothetical protein
VSKYKEPCGCESNDTHWTKLCPQHEEERKGREHEMKLDSLQWLITHYQRFPQEENLHHVVRRLAEVGREAYGRPAIVQFLNANANLVKQAIRAIAKPAAQ